MKVLVTGSSGNLGAEVARQLQGKHQVFGLDQNPGPFTSHQISLAERDVVSKLVSEVDAIIHTASLHAPHVDSYSREDFVDINIKGTLHLLEAAVQYQLKKFIYTSTTSVYGSAMQSENKAVWVTEQLNPMPRDIYDITKLAAEQLCEDFARNYPIKVFCLRTSRFWEEPLEDRLFYRLFRALDTRDAAMAHLLALENKIITYGLYNISGKSPFQPKDLEKLKGRASEVIKNYCPEFLSYFHQQGWKVPNEVDRVYVIDKAEKELGYFPKHNIIQFLKALQ